MLDIKPYIPDYDDPTKRVQEDDSISTDVSTPQWINNSEENLNVTFTPKALSGLRSIPRCPDGFDPPDQLPRAIQDILRGDPRSVYRRNRCDDRLYFFSVGGAKCTAWFDGGVAEVIKVEAEQQL